MSAAIALAIAWGTLWPHGSNMPSPPGGDKTMHVLCFALLVLPVVRAEPRRGMLYAGLAVAYGAAIETVQPFVGRQAEWLDLGADSVGVTLGIVMARLSRILLPANDQSPHS